MRGVVCVALAGYLAALAATPTGHGLRLAAHLLAEQHEALDGSAHHDEAHRDEAHRDETHHGEAHHGEAGHRGEAHQNPPSRRALAGARSRPSGLSPSDEGDSERASASERGVRVHGHGEAHGHDEAEHRGETHGHDEAHRREAPDHAADGLHAHHGRLHTHREAPAPPALLTLALDKHCVFGRGRLPAPTPARSLAAAHPGAIHAPVVLAVEVRPPQRAA